MQSSEGSWFWTVRLVWFWTVRLASAILLPMPFVPGKSVWHNIWSGVHPNDALCTVCHVCRPTDTDRHSGGSPESLRTIHAQEPVTARNHTICDIIQMSTLFLCLLTWIGGTQHGKIRSFRDNQPLCYHGMPSVSFKWWRPINECVHSWCRVYYSHSSAPPDRPGEKHLLESCSLVSAVAGSYVHLKVQMLFSPWVMDLRNVSLRQQLIRLRAHFWSAGLRTKQYVSREDLIHHISIGKHFKKTPEAVELLNEEIILSPFTQ